MKVCKKCGHPIDEHAQKYCATCRNIMYYLQGGGISVSHAIKALTNTLNIQLSKKERRILTRFLTMRRVKEMSNGLFFAAPRTPILTEWLFK